MVILIPEFMTSVNLMKLIIYKDNKSCLFQYRVNISTPLNSIPSYSAGKPYIWICITRNAISV